MKLVFLTNFLTHHQTEFCNEMYDRLGDGFTLIVMRSADREQKTLGYRELNDMYPYVLRVYDGLEQEQKAIRLCKDADIVILGAAPLRYIAERRKEDKITFIYTERLFKRGYLSLLHPAMLRTLYQKYTSQRQKNQYYLCAGAYTAKDINPFVHTPHKFFKWGYFPKTVHYDDVDMLINNKKKDSLIWVGRFIDWKHPELAVEIADRLRKDGYEFELNMLGNGVMLEDINAMIAKRGLANNVHVLGAKPSDQVRRYMEKAEIHIFTSDRNEGWGAVLNESMNSGCAVVADQAIGVVPFLLRDGENGLICDTRDVDGMYERVKYLLDNPEACRKLGRRAYETITEEWNAETAAQRLLALCEAFLDGNESPELYESGPCSRAGILWDQEL